MSRVNNTSQNLTEFRPARPVNVLKWAVWWTTNPTITRIDPHTTPPASMHVIATQRGHEGRQAVPQSSQMRLPKAWNPRTANSPLVRLVFALRQTGHCV